MAVARTYARIIRKYTTSTLLCVVVMLGVWAYNLSTPLSPYLRPTPAFFLGNGGIGYVELGDGGWGGRSGADNVGSGPFVETFTRETEIADGGNSGNDSDSNKNSNDNTRNKISKYSNSKKNSNNYTGNRNKNSNITNTSRNNHNNNSDGNNRIHSSNNKTINSNRTDSPHRQQRRLRLDPYRRWMRLWGGDGGECGQLKVMFGLEGSLPTCALASYPGSGNTWTRHLLQAASGVFTGSTYRDHLLYMNGFYGELDPWTSGTTLTQKTHECNPDLIKAFNGTGVLLLRNPYRAILSYHNFLFGGHIGYAPISNYRRKDWSAFVHLQARSWLEMATNWITEAKSLQVLHYEHLLEDLMTPLSSVLDFFGLPRELGRLQCLQRHEELTFKRREEFIPDNLEIFSITNRDKIDRVVRYVDYLLRKNNHPPLPIHLYEFYNNTSSTQVITLPCLAGENTFVCDERIDRLNLAKRRRTTARRTRTQTNTTAAGQVVEAAPGGRDEQINRQEKQDSLERFASTKVGWMVTKMFTGIMKYATTDPIVSIVGHPGSRELLLQPLLQDPVQ